MVVSTLKRAAMKVTFKVSQDSEDMSIILQVAIDPA
jgi:hypothetical protein